MCRVTDKYYTFCDFKGLTRGLVSVLQIKGIPIGRSNSWLRDSLVHGQSTGGPWTVYGWSMGSMGGP